MTATARLPRRPTVLATVLAAVLAIVVGACSPVPTASDGAPRSPSPTLAVPTAVATATLRPSPSATQTPTIEPAPTSAILPGAVDRSSLEVTATYDVDLAVTVGTGAIAVTTVIDARNDAGAEIDRLDLNTIAARLGGLALTGASVDGRPVAVTVDDQTLRVPLGGRLPDGASVTVGVQYTATLQPGLGGSDWLFSRAGGTLALYRWIPWVSRAVPFDRPNFGDPFVTPTSPRVRVRVTTDVPMVLASPGSVAPTNAASVRAWSFEVADVRDVAIVLATDFQVTTGNAGGVALRAYTRPGGLDGKRLITLATGTLTRMADRLGVPYPWPEYTVVETAGGFAMESPGLVWIPSGGASGNLPYLVNHETAHQWFYGLVGNDQQAEPFADEAPADLLARTLLGARRASRCAPAPLDRSIDRYSADCYVEVVYIQGGNVLDEVRASMGTDRFWTALGGYVTANRLELGGTRELLEALRAASPRDLLPILRDRFPSIY